MVALSLAFGLIVLVAGILITIGLISENELILGTGFVLLALCAIFGVQPTFLGRRTTDE